MASYHFHLTQVKRSRGQSVIAQAAYRAGEKLYSTYYGESSDFTRKRGVVMAEICLPDHAPREYADRETLWNALEWAESGRKAQLAHSFDITLMNEFSMEENIEMARTFVREELVSRGMIADFAIHDPVRPKGAEPNPHIHILVPIRPLKENGTWGIKEKKISVMDKQENLNRLISQFNQIAMEITVLKSWISEKIYELKRQMHYVQKPMLAGYLQQYYDERNRVARTYQYGSQKAMNTNLKQLAETIAFLSDENIDTPEELNRYYRGKRIIMGNRNTEGKVPVFNWKKYLKNATEEKETLEAEKKKVLEKLRPLQKVQWSVDLVMMKIEDQPDQENLLF